MVTLTRREVFVIARSPQGASGGVGRVLFLDQEDSYKSVWSAVVHYATCLCFIYFSTCVLYFIVRKLKKTFSKCSLRNIGQWDLNIHYSQKRVLWSNTFQHWNK